MIIFEQRYLVEARVRINERQQLTPGCRINYLIDPREREMILRTSFIQIRVINTHTPYDRYIRIFSLFLDKDWVCQPIRVQHLHNEAGCKQPSDLITNCFSSILGETPKDLFHWFGIQPNV